MFLIACNNKTVKEDTSKSEKTESKAIKKTSELNITSKNIKTKTGKLFIVKEEKTSASISKITIEPKGFSEVNDSFKMKESDPLDYTLIADLDSNGYEELYLITRGVGSGSYAQIYGFSSNKDKSISPIYISQLSEDDIAKLFPGYMGHDEFYIENNKLFRKYPVYKKEDSNAKPTGGNKILEYQLKMGESSWVLEIEN